MELIRGAEEMRRWSMDGKIKGERIGLVPTMGFLHEGHLSLARYARDVCDRVIVSIFVNPMQFGPSEDLAQYPRDLERDMGLLEPIGVDAVFHPGPEEMYPTGFQTRVEVTGVTQGLCGEFRPGHFVGVATVVLKLFNVTLPDLAVFGEKDYQQLVTIQRMARDLNLGVCVEGRPTVREDDGLAMSSRNTFLKPEERESARSLYQGLTMAREMARDGGTDPARIIERVVGHIESHAGARMQYALIVDPETMQALDSLDRPALMALAVFVGKTRLIDNLRLL